MTEKENLRKNMRFWLDARYRFMGGSADYAPPAGMSRQALGRLEAREAAGTVRLDTLAAAAEAMDCELLYVIRPKLGRAHDMYERQMRRTARKRAKARCMDEGLRPGTREYLALRGVLEFQIPRYIPAAELWEAWGQKRCVKRDTVDRRVD